MSTPNGPSIERLLYYMPICAERAEDEWAKGFALSVTKQSRRKNWRPSRKQLSVMKKLVSDLFAHAGSNDLELIEE